MSSMKRLRLHPYAFVARITPNIVAANTHYPIVSMDENLRAASVSGSGLGSFTRLQSERWLGPWSSPG